MAQRTPPQKKAAPKKEEKQKKTLEEKQQQESPPDIVVQTKEALQALIAIGIVFLLAIKLGNHISLSFNYDLFARFEYFKSIIKLSTLDLVASALAYSAGVDLAYMLFTPGPDEAIEPLMVGLASAILFSISNINGVANLELAKEIGLYVLILFFLFFMKALFIPEEDKSMISALLRKLKG